MAAKKARTKTSKGSKAEPRRAAAPTRKPAEKIAKPAAKGRKRSKKILEPTADARTKKSRKPGVKARPTAHARERTTVVRFQYAQLVQPLPGASVAQLTAIERHFGGALPTDYAEFLRGVNGGSPEPSYVPGKPYGFGIEAFYGAGSASDYYDVLQASRRISDDAGRTVVAIAGDGSGDQLVLLAPGDPGVYWWAHDSADEARRIAKSFDALLTSLCVAED